MNPFQLTMAYWRYRWLQTVLNGLLLTLGMGLVTFLLLLAFQLEQRLAQDGRGINLVVGAPGSKLQVVLSSVYHADVPTGNIDYSLVETLRSDELVAWAIPLGLGDSYAGFRIVGTEPAYAALYEARPVAGRMFAKSFEAVIGAAVAQRVGLQVGDTFTGSHGLGEGDTQHAGHPYQVVGRLAYTGTVLDRLILTPITSLERAHGVAHGEHDQPHAATAILVGYASPVAAVTLPPKLTANHGVTAASPGEEVARLLSLVGIGLDVFRWFAWIMVAAAGLGVFIALYNAMHERRFDWAVMRSLGASRRQLLTQVLLEGVGLTLLGTLAGMLMGHLVAEILRRTVAQAQIMGLTGRVLVPAELGLLLLAVVLGLLAAALPAMRAYRTPIARTLARG